MGLSVGIYKQCIQAGGHVRKGEKAHMVVFWKWLQQKDEETGEIKEILYLRYYNVFYISQCEEITAKYIWGSCTPVTADLTVESIISSYLGRSGLRWYHKDIDRAFYRPSDDSITLPLRSRFKNTAAYYSTTYYEILHSTGHASRLNRIINTDYFGSEGYSKEELVAEIGSAALVNHTGLETTASFRNNAAYIQSWLQVLRNDKRFIVSAAGKAEKAVNLILGKSVCQQKA